MFVVISYDIPSDKRRTKVAKALEGYGTRVQYSVFEVNLPSGQIERLRAELRKLIDEKEDSLRFYALCRACYGRIDVVGVGQAVEKPPGPVIV